jgi:thiosulfate/3-mercaptopyruvate sulfurtransferase
MDRGAAMNEPLISPESLGRRLDDPNRLLVECPFDLADPEKGRREYEAAHSPGAVYANLDTDLSDLAKQGL